MTPVLVVLAAIGSLFFATSIYLGWRLTRISDSAGEWRERCERAEKHAALLGRHLGGIAEVIHGHGGGVVNRYYETSALRFILVKQAPAVVGRDSSVPQWLRAQAEFFHALADRAFGVDTDAELRKRIDGIRAAHAMEISAYETMAISPPTAPTRLSVSESVTDDADDLATAERDASRYLAQLAAAFAFAGRLAPAGVEGERAPYAVIERLCEASNGILEMSAAEAADERRARAILDAIELMRAEMGNAALSAIQAKRPLPSASQLSALRVLAERVVADQSVPMR